MEKQGDVLDWDVENMRKPTWAYLGCPQGREDWYKVDKTFKDDALARELDEAIMIAGEEGN